MADRYDDSTQTLPSRFQITALHRDSVIVRYFGLVSVLYLLQEFRSFRVVFFGACALCEC